VALIFYNFFHCLLPCHCQRGPAPLLFRGKRLNAGRFIYRGGLPEELGIG